MRLMRRRSLAITLAIIALVGVVTLLVWSPSLLSARGRSAQVFIFSDDQHPDTTTLLLSVAEALPLFQSFKDQRMTCDGVAFSYGAAPWQTIVGYYGDVRTRPARQSYHCALHDWQGEIALDIPAIAAPTYARFITPTQHARLSRETPIDVTLAFAPGAPYDGAPEMMLQARDWRAHYWWDDSYGAGGYKGHAEFKPVAARGLSAGSGAIVAQYQINQFPAVAGWQNVQLLYRPATVLPVTWA
jgi:hypothetical protein